MGYQKISEYISKKLFNPKYPILRLVKDETPSFEIADFLDEHGACILKVDQFVKRRGKKGLIKPVSSCSDVYNFIKNVDYEYFVLEKKISFTNEHYLCFRYLEDKIEFIFNEFGGVDCSHPLENAIISYSLNDFITQTGLPEDLLNHLYQLFLENHGKMLEINPLVKTENDYLPLDFAFEVDKCGFKTSLENSKSKEVLLPVETAIQELDENSGASLKFKVLNQKGKIWTLIAGGGASVLYTDAIVELGYSQELANYGEYSGNPSQDEVFQYCHHIFNYYSQQEYNFSEGLNRCYLFIGGGVSNFTDVKATFTGIILAIEKHLNLFQKNNVCIKVRRGGVNEKEGLKYLSEKLLSFGLDVEVRGSETMITQIVSNTLPKLNNNKSLEEFPTFTPQYQTKEVNLFQENVIFVGKHLAVIQRIIDYDYYVGREHPTIKYIYDTFSSNSQLEFFWGNQSIKIPLINNVSLLDNQNYGVYNFGSLRSAQQIVDDFSLPNIKSMFIIAEGIPERNAIELRQKPMTILGPSSVGAIKGGKNGIRIGNVGGKMDNIERCGLCHEGNVVILTKSGGLLNEMINYVSNKGMNIFEAVSIGGDRFPGLTLVDLMNHYLNQPQVKTIFMIGETGGIEELKAAQLYRDSGSQIPVYGWCSGTSEKSFGENVEFGHAGANAHSQFEEAAFKNNFMRLSGVRVPETFEQLDEIVEVLAKGEQCEGRKVPMDLQEAMKTGLIRNKPTFTTAMADERTNLVYRGVPIEKVLENQFSFGKTLGLLWLNVKLDDWAAEYLEKIIVLMAEHGPAVSGAHNTIVSARANKNLTESLCSGILTIGPRFGGAIAQGAQDVFNSYLSETPDEMIRRFKKEGKYIMGIGHKVKSKFNSDGRVEYLKKFIKERFPERNVFEYFCSVEKLCLEKKPNLILNVDGAVGASLIDLLLNYKNTKEVKELLKTDLFNGFFVLARSIGMIGHYQESKGKPLYRVPDWEIKYEKN